MSIGMQELIALFVVTVIVGFALYRRWRRKKAGTAGCADCASGAAHKTDEAPIRVYRRQD